METTLRNMLDEIAGAAQAAALKVEPAGLSDPALARTFVTVERLVKSVKRIHDRLQHAIEAKSLPHFTLTIAKGKSKAS